MVMSWIWTTMLLISILFSWLTGNGAGLSASVLQGAQAGFTLAISMAGGLCLWSGIGHLMTHMGLTGKLACLLRPILVRLFPETRQDPDLAADLSANICANLLGLGNAATPMGIQAAKRLSGGKAVATDELCRLIVLNTASIQLIPANVAAVRAQMGAASAFDILPGVWLTSLASAGMGLLAARFLGRIWKA